MNFFDNAFIYGSLKRGVESTQGNYRRQLVKGLGSTAERRMRGCPVSLNRLIIRMFWLKCKDERKRRNDRLGEDGSIFPYIKNTKVFLENLPIFSENTKVFLKNTKVFLQQESVSKRNRPIPSSAVGAGFACPKTQSKLFSGERTSPLPTKRQHYPLFDTSPCL